MGRPPKLQYMNLADLSLITEELNIEDGERVSIWGAILCILLDRGLDQNDVELFYLSPLAEIERQTLINSTAYLLTSDGKRHLLDMSKAMLSHEDLIDLYGRASDKKMDISTSKGLVFEIERARNEWLFNDDSNDELVQFWCNEILEVPSAEDESDLKHFWEREKKAAVNRMRHIKNFARSLHVLLSNEHLLKQLDILVETQKYFDLGEYGKYRLYDPIKLAESDPISNLLGGDLPRYTYKEVSVPSVDISTEYQTISLLINMLAALMPAYLTKKHRRINIDKITHLMTRALKYPEKVKGFSSIKSVCTLADDKHFMSTALKDMWTFKKENSKKEIEAKIPIIVVEDHLPKQF